MLHSSKPELRRGAFGSPFVSRDTAPTPVRSQESSGSSPRLAASRRGNGGLPHAWRFRSVPLVKLHLENLPPSLAAQRETLAPVP